MNAVRNIRINTRLMSAIGIIFLFVAIVTIGIVNWKMKQHALKEAESKAGIMIDRNLAIHTYFTHQLKPVLFDMIEKNEAFDTDPKHLGEQIDLPEGKELAELVMAFNEMSIQLYEDRTHLETRIDERTHELKKTNERLQHEIIERKQTIGELKQTLNEVKILRGILPICSYCKKIRDDKGYWNKLESYIQNHSEAKFSHGICEVCLEEFYPEE